MAATIVSFNRIQLAFCVKRIGNIAFLSGCELTNLNNDISTIIRCAYRVSSRITTLHQSTFHQLELTSRSLGLAIKTCTCRCVFTEASRQIDVTGSLRSVKTGNLSNWIALDPIVIQLQVSTVIYRQTTILQEVRCKAEIAPANKQKWFGR